MSDDSQPVYKRIPEGTKANCFYTCPGFLDHIYFRRLKEILTGDEFQWYYNNNISYHQEDKPSLGLYGFSHWFKHPNKEGWTTSKWTDLFSPVFYKTQSFIQGKKILRARADMVTYQPKQIVYDQHTDFEFENMATILYMNETDGDTIFYKDGVEVNRYSPQQNTLVIFPGNIMHTGSSPVKHNQRILLNSNYVC